MKKNLTAKAGKVLLTALIFGMTASLFPTVPVSSAKTKKVTIKIKGKKKVTLTVGKTKKLKVKVTGAKAKKVKWKSSKKKVVTVNKKGKIKAVAAGKATVTARIKKKKVSFKITVKAAKKAETQTNTKKDTIEQKEVSVFSRDMSNFSVTTLSAAMKEAGNTANTLISADSIATALAMTQNGAAGDTLTEMLKVLAPGLSLDEYNTALSNFNKQISSSETVDMHIADSIWIKNDDSIKIRDSFSKKNASLFDAYSYLEPFDTTTVKKINEWVNKNTNQMIPSIIDQIPTDTVMYLINAIAFEGKWADQFTDSQVEKNATFTNQNGSKSKVNMLSGSEDYYIELGKGTGFVKPYAGGDLAFVGILPPAGMTNQDYLASFTGEEFASAVVNKKADKFVSIQLPEFSYDYSINLNNTLKAMGIQKAFTGNADFSQMVEKSANPVKIDSVLHKTHIELDQNGTKAAAVTAVEASASAMLKTGGTIEIFLNRPFLYAIVDMDTGIPIFMGSVNQL